MDTAFGQETILDILCYQPIFLPNDIRNIDQFNLF